jgi:hypothetical protein
MRGAMSHQKHFPISESELEVFELKVATKRRALNEYRWIYRFMKLEVKSGMA